jgi:hypothetical protein
MRCGLTKYFESEPKAFCLLKPSRNEGGSLLTRIASKGVVRIHHGKGQRVNLLLLSASIGRGDCPLHSPWSPPYATTKCFRSTSVTRRRIYLAQDCLASRRKMGFALVVQGKELLLFARYCDHLGHQDPITTEFHKSPFIPLPKNPCNIITQNVKVIAHWQVTPLLLSIAKLLQKEVSEYLLLSGLHSLSTFGFLNEMTSCRESPGQSEVPWNIFCITLLCK